MALYGGKRDISLFNGFNKEMVVKIMDTVVLFFKPNLYESKDNLYGESLKKVWNTPVQIACVINNDDQATTEEQFGPDVTQITTFAFLRNLLKEVNIYPEIGDIILWNNGYYEVDTVVENRLIAGKNPDAQLVDHGEEFGSNHTIVCIAHLTRMDSLDIEDYKHDKTNL